MPRTLVVNGRVVARDPNHVQVRTHVDRLPWDESYEVALIHEDGAALRAGWSDLVGIELAYSPAGSDHWYPNALPAPSIDRVEAIVQAFNRSPTLVRDRWLWTSSTVPSPARLAKPLFRVLRDVRVWLGGVHVLLAVGVLSVMGAALTGTTGALQTWVATTATTHAAQLSGLVVLLFGAYGIALDMTRYRYESRVVDGTLRGMTDHDLYTSGIVSVCMGIGLLVFG